MGAVQDNSADPFSESRLRDPFSRANLFADPDKKKTQSEAARATWTDPAMRARAMKAVRGLEALHDPSAGPRSYQGEAVYESAAQTEAKLQARRKQLASSLAPDAADMAIRDAATGRVRRARTGSSRSALGSFDMTKPLGPSSILGGE